MRRSLAIGVAICVLFAGGADAALVRVGNLVLTADGGFTPHRLPQRRFVPIEFKGHANLRAVDGSVPPPLRRAVIDFDRDGRLAVNGLASCPPERLEGTSSSVARRVCGRALVGEGRLAAVVAGPGAAPLKTGSVLLLFNGPRQGGHPTAIAHARLGLPSPQTYVLTVPIKRRRGDFRYRTIVDVPPIAAGRGALTHVSLRIGRRFRFRGSPRSYVSARCRDGIFRTHGRFAFADAEHTIVDGSVEKPCTPR